MIELSLALTMMLLPEIAGVAPLARLPEIKARVSTLMRFATPTPDPEIAKAVEPAAIATEPEKAVASIDCAVTALTLIAPLVTTSEPAICALTETAPPPIPAMVLCTTATPSEAPTPVEPMPTAAEAAKTEALIAPLLVAETVTVPPAAKRLFSTRAAAPLPMVLKENAPAPETATPCCPSATLMEAAWATALMVLAVTTKAPLTMSIEKARPISSINSQPVPVVDLDNFSVPAAKLLVNSSAGGSLALIALTSAAIVAVSAARSTGSRLTTPLTSTSLASVALSNAAAVSPPKSAE